MEFHSQHRSSPAHPTPVGAHNRSIIIFLTVCTAKRQRLLATSAAHELLMAAWNQADRWQVGRYVVMPDHIHLFCSPNSIAPTSLGLWIRYRENLVTRQWAKQAEKPLWQKNFWDTQLRTHQSYDARWRYVLDNPVRHGLVADPSGWPYQGEIRRLKW